MIKTTGGFFLLTNSMLLKWLKYIKFKKINNIKRKNKLQNKLKTKKNFPAAIFLKSIFDKIATDNKILIKKNINSIKAEFIWFSKRKKIDLKKFKKVKNNKNLIQFTKKFSILEKKLNEKNKKNKNKKDEINK